MIAMIHPDHTPPGYPAEIERDLVLADGTAVRLRPIVPEDAAVLSAEILTADSETLYHRFFTTAVQPDEEMMRSLTVMDYSTALAVGCIARASRQPLGVARYGEIAADTVEVAVVVKPDWRRMGVADLLLDVVESAAAGRGYSRATAFHLDENEAIASLLAGRGYDVIGVDRGIAERGRELGAQPRSV